MEYQKIPNLLDDASNQPSKFKTKNWVEINDTSRGTYNANSEIKFKTTMLKSSLCDYSDAYLLVKRIITITGAGDDAGARQTDERDEDVAFKNCAPIFKTSGSLWQYYRDEPNDNLADSGLFKSKIKITGKATDNGNEIDVEVMIPLKYLSLSNFWRTIEMPSINCEVSLILIWSSTCVITNSTSAGAFEITDTKLYVPVITLSTQDSAKLLQQLKSGFKRVVNWNKY